MATDSWDNSHAALLQFTLSNGGLTATANNAFHNETIIGQVHHPSGKWYFEMQITSGPLAWGIATQAQSNTGVLWDTGVGLSGINESWILNGTNHATGAISNPANEIIGIAVDIDNKLIWYRETSVPGTWYGNNGTGDPATGTNGFSFAAAPGAGQAMYIAYTYSEYGSTQPATMNAGGTTFAATAPSGFLAWENISVSGPFATSTGVS
jgi:hypothetical protein